MVRSKLFFALAVILLSAFAVADDTTPSTYTEAGTVLASIDKHGHFYQVSTDSKVYLFLCTKVKSIQFGSPECKILGKPIAQGDTVHFRIDGDWAYMPPASEGIEEKLRILTTELKVIPPLPTGTMPPAKTPEPATSAKDNKTSASEPAVTIGTGVHVKGQHGLGWSTTPGAVHPAIPSTSMPGITTASASTPVVATGPVMATPVTGGAPVLVTPTAPSTGGVVTGVPVTGGAPITAVPVAPVTGVPMAGAPVAGAPGGGMMIGGGGAPQWVHVLRIQTAGKIYQLECSGKPCAIANKEIALGDGVTLRADKKHAYLSFSASGQAQSAEQEFKILEVTDIPPAQDPRPQDPTQK